VLGAVLLRGGILLLFMEGMGKICAQLAILPEQWIISRMLRQQQSPLMFLACRYPILAYGAFAAMPIGYLRIPIRGCVACPSGSTPSVCCETSWTACYG